ncbi:MAG TPA: hypothetical protein PLJ46_09585, partial [Burkholderiaceae bacterium]|nr:hypothetical protein [Burkholderiaceae bacterium]
MGATPFSRVVWMAVMITLVQFTSGCEKKREAPKPPRAEVVAPAEKAQESSSAPDQQQIYRNAWSLKTFRKTLIEAEVAEPQLSGPVPIPFTKFVSRDAVGAVWFDPKSGLSRLKLDSGPTLRFQRRGVPVFMESLDDDLYAVVFRAIPRNDISLLHWNARTGTVQTQGITRDGVDYLLFRTGHFDGKLLSLIVYDNHSAKNYLRRYEKTAGRWQPVAEELELPTLEDPAGTHYEMEPPLKIFAEGNNLTVVGGNLLATVAGKAFSEVRIPDCQRVVEAVHTPAGIAVLCNRKTVDQHGAYLLKGGGATPATIIATSDGIPWSLHWRTDEKRLGYRLAKDSNSYTELLEFDIARAQNSGLLDFGSDNIEGRVPWSQIYYLNGLLDAIYMARRDDKAFEIFVPIARQIRLRLELEIRLLDQLLDREAGMRTRAFTYDRSLALFAVQTSRLLLLFDRYQTEFPDAKPLRNHDRLRKQVGNLDQHIEVLSNAGESEKWLKAKSRHLRWPRGSAFYFDGLPVPYNHQNEWAYAMFQTNRALGTSVTTKNLAPQREIIQHFLDNLSTNGGFPPANDWHYWWGQAFDGYDAASGQSVNTPAYVGDKSIAWISFRTIDLMSVMASLDFMPNLDGEALKGSALDRLRDGDIYPFATRSLLDAGAQPGLNERVVHRYARTGAPWDISNQVWALAMLPVTSEPEDPHSSRLNAKLLEQFPSLSQSHLASKSSKDAFLKYLRIALPYNAGQMLKHAGGEL